MIAVLRKIRQNLIGDGKLNRYLIYAIGEIFLVVIGILIALSINSWYNNNKERKIEQDYIADLVQDLRIDTIIYSDVRIKSIKEKEEALNQVKDYVLESYQIRDTLSFLLKAGYAAKYGKVQLSQNNSTYLELVSTGNLRVIKDRKIRKDLVRYYSVMAAMASSIKDTRSDYADYINSLRPFNPDSPNIIAVRDQKFMLKGLQEGIVIRKVNQELSFAYNFLDYFRMRSESSRKLLEKLEQYRTK